jgi:hypothetical protein
MGQAQRRLSSSEYISTASKRDWNSKWDLKSNAAVTVTEVLCSITKWLQKIQMVRAIKKYYFTFRVTKEVN